MLSLKDLENLQQADITTIEKSSLVNIKEISIDGLAPIDKRANNFFTEIKNPYCFMCGDTPVQISYAADRKPLAKTLEVYFTSLK